jgi:alpha,alpha-trehalase
MLLLFARDVRLCFVATFPRHFFFLISKTLLRARAFHTIISASSSPTTVFARRGGARGGVVVVLSAFTKLCWCHAARPPRRAARCKWSAGGLTSFYHKTTTTTTGFSERRRRGGRSAAAVVASSSANNDNDSYSNDSFYEEDLERLRQTVENERKMNIETTSSEMRSKREEESEDLSSEAAEAKAFKNPLLSQDDLMPPRSDSPAIDISFAHGFDSHHSLTSVQEVYTNLAILDAAHQSMNFLDSKDFVDTEIRSSASVTISNFLNIGNNREGTIGSGRGEESTSVGAGSAAAAGTSGMGQIMERESKTDEDVMKQFFEGHFFEGPSGLNDIGGSGNRGGGEEGTVANELVNLLNDWTEMPSVIAKLLHPEILAENGGGTVKLSTSMGRLNSIQEDEEVTMMGGTSNSAKKEGGGLGDADEEEAYKHHAKAIQLARHCNNTWPLLARSVAPSANQRQSTPLEYATGSNTPRGVIPNSPLASPKMTRTIAVNQQVQSDGSSLMNNRVSALTGAIKSQLQINPAFPQNQPPYMQPQQQKSSLIPLPHVAIVPGERFRETYYWDTYWVALGLLESDMYSTATGVIRNLLSMVERFGYVPNGSRVYYLNRSQPPVLATAVRAIYEATRDIELLKYAVPLLQREHKYMTRPEKCINVVSQSTGNLHTLSRYWAYTEKPRPESYREDLDTAKEFCNKFCDSKDSKEKTDRLRADLFRDIASAAESGHDFSSRWFEDRQSIRTIRTTKIVPADLNGFMYKMERDIAWLARQLEQNVESVEEVEYAQELATQFEIMAETRRNAIYEVIWDDSEKRWRDLVLRRSKFDTYNIDGTIGDPSLHKNNRFDDPDAVYEYSFAPGPYASDWVPLWCGVFEKNSKEALDACESLRQSPIVDAAGIACSTVKSGEQWDFPNVWAPLTHMLVEGVSEYGGEQNEVYANFAKTEAHKYLKSVSKGLRLTHAMHEKYDCRFFGAIGRGGEYAPQTGFGWTNGVALAFLAKYGGWNEEEEGEETEAPRMGLCETQACEDDGDDLSSDDDTYSSSEEDEQYRYSD